MRASTLPQHVLRAQRLAAMRERNDDTLAGAHERSELVLGLGETARGDRRPLRLERERLVLRERIELRRPLERERRELVLFPDAPNVVGLEDEVGRTIERRHEIVRHRPDVAFVAVPLLDQVETPLRGGIDRARLDGMQRALRERRERADRLHLVAEELDAKRLASGRREDVDDAAANGELTAVVDPLDALVAGERKHLREASTPSSTPGASSIGAGRACGGGSGFGEARADAHTSPPRVEDVERSRSLADEVRRRLEPRLPA